MRSSSQIFDRCLMWLLLPALSLFFSSLALAQETKTSPKLIRGKIVEADDSAIADAAIRFTLASWDKKYEKRIVHAQGKLKSDKDGLFELKVKEALPEDREPYLNVSVGSKLHFAQSIDFSDDVLWKESVDLGTVKLVRGVLVKGQLVSPIAGETKLDNPTVHFWSDYHFESVGGSYFYRSLNCDADGKFECVVPNHNKLSMTFGANRFALTEIEKKLEVPEPTDPATIPEFDLGSLKLETGVSVVGTAKLKDGSPARDVVVSVIEWGDDGGSLEGGQQGFGVRSSVKTDAKGKFRVEPHRGKCTVLVMKHGRSRKIVAGEEEILESGFEVPFFDPVDLDLEGKGPEFVIELREADSVEISGTVYDARGKPVSKAILQTGWMSIFGPLGYKRIEADEKGRYVLRTGKGFKAVIRPIDIGQTDAYVTAETVEDYPELFHSTGKLLTPKFKAFNKDVTHLNWELLPPETANPSTLERVGNALQWWFSE